ncbi:MAG TPA: hypothetical protein VGP19_14645 [Candidatus Acidoferrales bacterium]|jgi:hypothetical protein|nr:hypothetical protein [Candidatus Acidoferrales bacterium]
MRRFVATVALLVFSPLLAAQQALNNDSVIKLVKAGLSEDLVVSTINASPGAYNTSADSLIALKTAGASDKVISAIVVKSASPALATPAPVPEPPAVDARANPGPQAQSSAALATQESAQPPSVQTTSKPRVFLEASSKGPNRNAERDQSMEMSKDLERDCPGARVTINQQMADYTINLNHIEVGLLVRDNQIQVANRDGDLISKTKEGGSIAGGMKKACELVLADWARR